MLKRDRFIRNVIVFGLMFYTALFFDCQSSYSTHKNVECTISEDNNSLVVDSFNEFNISDYQIEESSDKIIVMVTLEKSID